MVLSAKACALRACAALVFTALVACDGEGTPLGVTGVSPSTGHAGSEIALRVSGQGFAPAFRVSYRNEANSALSTEFLCWLGDRPLADVTYVDAQTLTATVPPDLSTGIYELNVRDPAGNVAGLIDAFEVLPAVNGPDSGSHVVEGGTPEGGAPEASQPDTAATDRLGADSAPLDALQSDLEGLDAGSIDLAAALDAARDDALSPDSLLPDASLPDASLPDIGGPVCGNGIPETGEECDDNNLIEGDGCTADCRIWWHADWGFRAPVIIDNPSAEELTSVPVLIALSAANFTYGNAAADGADLRLIDEDHATPLAFEIELWDAAATSYVWVRAPLLVTGSDARSIWLYYGNGSASAAQDPATLWSDYAAVWHMDRVGAGSDVTGFGNDLVNHNGDGGDPPQDVATGAVGHAMAFAQSSAARTENSAPGQDRLEIIGDLALSAWARFDALLSHESGNTIASMGACNVLEDSRTNYPFHLNMTDTPRMQAFHEEGSGTNIFTQSDADAPVVLGTFHFLALVRDAASLEYIFYFDGYQIGTPQSFSALPDTRSDSDTSLSIGQDAVEDCPIFPSGFMDGAIDEVRIRAAQVSAGWIEMQFASMTQSAVSVGSEETLPSP